MQQSSRKFSKFLSIIIALLIPTVGYLQRWNIYDAWRLNGYEPANSVVKLADETSVNDKTRRLFYVNRPSIDPKEVFRKHCTTGELTIVLGCFISFDGIYLQEITDERLAGVMQVTTAHEILHAAYQRLNNTDKEKVDKLINENFAKINNERIKQTIEDYKKNGADITNELHSILATEVRELTPELETYYKRYFTDRSKVVAYSEHYEAAFTNRKTQISAYEGQLQELKKQIDITNGDLANKLRQIESSERNLEQLKQSNVNAYNNAVPGHNYLVDQYRNLITKVNSLINQYNSIVKNINDISAEEKQLIEAIDSRL